MNLKIFSIALALTSSLPTLAFAMDDNTEEVNAVVSAPTFRMDQAMSAISTLLEKTREHIHNTSDDEVYNEKSIQSVIQALAEKYAAEMLKDEAMKSAVKAVKTVENGLLKFNDDQFKEVGLRAVEKVDHEGTRISFDNIKLQLQKDEILKGEKYSYALWKIIQSFKAIQLSLSDYTTQGHKKIGAFLKHKGVKKPTLQKITAHIETLETLQGVSLGKNPTMERAVSAIEKLFYDFENAEDKSKEETKYLNHIWQLEARFKKVIECLEDYFKLKIFTYFLWEERNNKSLDEYFREKYPWEAADQIIKPASLTLEKSMLEENPHQTQAITSIMATSSTEETTIPSVVTASSSQTKENIAPTTVVPVAASSNTDEKGQSIQAVPPPPPPSVTVSSPSIKSAISLSEQLAAVSLTNASEQTLLSPPVNNIIDSEDQKARLQKASDPASDVDIANPGLRRAFRMFWEVAAEFCDN